MGTLDIVVDLAGTFGQILQGTLNIGMDLVGVDWGGKRYIGHWVGSCRNTTQSWKGPWANMNENSIDDCNAIR